MTGWVGGGGRGGDFGTDTDGLLALEEGRHAGTALPGTGD